MAEVGSIPLEPPAASGALPDVLPDDRARDEAYQALMRTRTEEARLSARMEQRAGLVPGEGDLDTALAEPDIDQPTRSTGRLAAARQAVAARQRVQQVQQAVQTAQTVARVASRTEWLVAIGTFLVENAPIIFGVVLTIFIVTAVATCGQNPGLCTGVAGELALKTFRSFFGGDTNTTPPASSGTVLQGAANPNPATQSSP